jgi:DNA polymerase-3 subunit alpha
MKVIREISKEEFKAFLFEDIDTDDKNIYKEMNSDSATGIFQLSAETAKKFAKQIKPQNLDELDALNALSRPGSSGMLPFYIDAKENGARMYSKKISEVFSATMGVPIYQEQIMNVFHKIGGFTLEESNEVRSSMKRLSKLVKDPKDVENWKKQVERFTENAVKNGIQKEEAERLAEDLVKFSSYSFNKSHSISYTLIAVITLFLSFYFRKYFYSALLAYNMTKDEADILSAVNAIKANGIELLPPDINESQAHLSVVDDKIMFGLADVKGISEKPFEKILEMRPYKSFFDFVMKTRSRELSSSVIEGLISVGAFDCFTKERVKLAFAFKKFWEEKKTIKVEEKLKFIWDRCWANSNSLPGLDTTNDKLMELEKKYYGVSIFTSPFDTKMLQALAKMKSLAVINGTLLDVSAHAKKTPVVLRNLRTQNDKNGHEMAFIEVEDTTGSTAKIPIFYSFWQFLKDNIQTESIYLMTLYRNDDGQIMFGDNKWTKDEVKILSFVRKLK